MTEINFKVAHHEINVIHDIARRAMAMSKEHDLRYTMIEASMDITACHCNGQPLLLTSLRDADDFNFAHDVFGIRRHINRDTGKLEDCFVPRFSAVQRNV